MHSAMELILFSVLALYDCNADTSLFEEKKQQQT